MLTCTSVLARFWHQNRLVFLTECGQLNKSSRSSESGNGVRQIAALRGEKYRRPFEA
jgi:hypothetical protein